MLFDGHPTELALATMFLKKQTYCLPIYHSHFGVLRFGGWQLVSGEVGLEMKQWMWKQNVRTYETYGIFVRSRFELAAKPPANEDSKPDADIVCRKLWVRLQI
jgi:hypothetical protein